MSDCYDKVNKKCGITIWWRDIGSGGSSYNLDLGFPFVNLKQALLTSCNEPR